MTPKKDPSFPEDAFAEAALVYGELHDLPQLAAQCGARKPGYRLQSLGRDELARLLAERAAEHVPARRKALKGMLEAFAEDDPGLEAGVEVKDLRRRVRKLKAIEGPARAAWIAALLLDSREEVRALAAGLAKKAKGAGKETRTAALRRERDEARTAHAESERDRQRLAREVAGLEEDRETARADRERLMTEARRLRREVSREVERRKAADLRAESAAAEAASRDETVRRLKQEVLELRRQPQVRESGGSRKEWRSLRSEVDEWKDKHVALTRDYSALKLKLRNYEERMAEAWSTRKLREKALRPREPDEPLVVEPPLETDSRDAAEKVRLPADPHHWPGGHERFRRFLERIARHPHVTRVVPQKFARITRHEIGFVTDGGDLVGRVSDGDTSALVLILTTATHRGQGEHIRRELAPLFDDGSL